jgi:hypothetical protein
MFITEEDAKMQRRREQKSSRAVRRIAMQSEKDRQSLRELNTERQCIRQQNVRKHAQVRINMPQEEARII